MKKFSQNPIVTAVVASIITALVIFSVNGNINIGSIKASGGGGTLTISPNPVYQGSDVTFITTDALNIYHVLHRRSVYLKKLQAGFDPLSR